MYLLSLPQTTYYRLLAVKREVLMTQRPRHTGSRTFVVTVAGEVLMAYPMNSVNKRSQLHLLQKTPYTT